MRARSAGEEPALAGGTAARGVKKSATSPPSASASGHVTAQQGLCQINENAWMSELCVPSAFLGAVLIVTICVLSRRAAESTARRQPASARLSIHPPASTRAHLPLGSGTRSNRAPGRRRSPPPSPPRTRPPKRRLTAPGVRGVRTAAEGTPGAPKPLPERRAAEAPKGRSDASLAGRAPHFRRPRPPTLLPHWFNPGPRPARERLLPRFPSPLTSSPSEGRKPQTSPTGRGSAGVGWRESALKRPTIIGYYCLSIRGEAVTDWLKGSGWAGKEAQSLREWPRAPRGRASGLRACPVRAQCRRRRRWQRQSWRLGA